MNLGDAATLDGMRQITSPEVWERGRYEPVNATDVHGYMHYWLLGQMRPRQATQWEPPFPQALDVYALEVAVTQFGLRYPVGALAHRDVPLYAHRDTQNPVRCINVTTFFRQYMNGGWLVLDKDGIALDCAHGSAAVFDGQQLHGVTDTEPDALNMGGLPHRISLTMYCPL